METVRILGMGLFFFGLTSFITEDKTSIIMGLIMSFIGIIFIVFPKIFAINKIKQEGIKEESTADKKAIEIIGEKVKSKGLVYNEPFSEEEEGYYNFNDKNGEVKWCYPESNLKQSLIKNDYNLEKAIVELNKKYEKTQEEYQIQEKIDEMKERERKRKIREEAEKRLYGKVKTKRQAFTEDEKEMILSKFNNECVICGAKEGLHIHHKDGNPKNNAMNNLIVLCGVCHKKTHMKVR